MMEKLEKEARGGQSPEDQRKRLHEAVLARFSAPGLVERLLQKDTGGQSVLTLLEEMEAAEEMEDTYRDLLTELRDLRPSGERVSQAVAKVVTEAPQKLLETVREERARYAERQEQVREAAEDFVVIDREDVLFQQRMRRNTLLLSKVMPEDIFLKMCDALAKEGYVVSQKPVRPQGQGGGLAPPRDPDRGERLLT